MASGRNDDSKAIARARRLRRRMNLVEKLIWFHISRSQTGYRFRRQVPFGSYVLDFYCATVRFAVEIDGPHHELRRETDVERDKWLADRGVAVLRIPAELAYECPTKAVELIVAACRTRDKDSGPALQ